MNKGLLGKAKIPIAILSIVLVAIFVMTFVIPSMAVDGSANEDSTYILTDKADYNPGETVYISGSGFTPSSTISIQVTRPDGVDVCPVSTPFVKCTDLPVTDGSGSFSNYAYKLNGVEGAYVVDASDGNLSAQTTFTDSRTISGATLNGSSAVIASPSDTITAAVTVITSGSGTSNDWLSTAYRIGDSGSYTCVDTSDHTSSGTFTESFTITAPATTGVYNVSFIAYSDNACSCGASGIYLLTNGIRVIQTNPQLSSSCGIDIALIIDNSGTIDSTELTTMKNAFKDFVDAFLPNTPTQMAVVKFNTVGDIVLDYSGDATTIKNAINSVTTTSGYTNWQDGLKEAYDEFDNRADKPDLYVFASDGQPNRFNDPAQGSGGGIDPAALVAAITTANIIKSSGVRIIALGIGTGGDQNFILNLKSISSNDAFYDTNFETLADTLATLADDLCGGTITVKKLVDGQLASGWTFDASATGGTVTPTTSTTNGDGYINPAFDIEIPGSSATASVTETSQVGYDFVSASCVNQNQQSVGSCSAGACTGIIVGKNDAIYCEFQNSMIACGSYTDKTSCDLDANCDWCSQCAEPDFSTYGKAKVNTWHEGTCVPTGNDCGYHCELGYCNADCVDGSDCPCPQTGCKGLDYYVYPTNGNCPHCPCICQNGTAPGQPCAPSITYNDPRCSICGNGIVESGEQCDPGQNVPGDCCNANCQFESNAYTCRESAGICDTAETCSGSSALCPNDIKSTALCRQNVSQCDAEEYCDGINNNCPPDEDAPLSTPCNDGLWCSATDHCDGQGNCVQNTARDCSGFNLTKIETCDNNPDSYHFTWDFRNSFTSICNETNDSCTSVNDTITHTCSVSNCSANCDSTHSCQNNCVGNVRYYSGNCSLTTCNCSYSTENCDLQDNCYSYSTGCEDRDYSCAPNNCTYNYTNRNTDYNDSFVNYCSADTIRTHRTSHDFYCGSICTDHTNWVNDSLIENCNLQDGWYNTSTTRWIDIDQCNERQQLQQEYRDYTCSPTPTVNCTFNVNNTQWINSSQTRNKPNGTACDDGQYCTVSDVCTNGQCGGSSRDCSGNNLTEIAQCSNNPDSNPFTFDYAPGFTSICNETLDICTNSTYTYTHTCADSDSLDNGPKIPVGDGVRACTAECDSFGTECQNKCIGNIRYYSGNCNLTGCSCSYTTENCDSQDNCYVYETGCEDRDYFCQVAGCNYTFSNRSTDSYDSYINYCSDDTIRKHRTFHDFSCDNGCKDHTSLVNDSQVEDCNLQDGWYNTTTTQWVSTGQCTEKEQLYQDERDYTCSDASCTFSVIDHRWIDTGQTRNKPDTTACDDNNFCTINDHCDGQGACIGGGSYGCSGNNLQGISTCDWNPDAFSSTFDWRLAFTSECINTGNNTGHCTSGNNTVDHFCADENNQDGGPVVNGVRTCSAQCDGFGAECLPYLDQDYCYVNGTCNSNPSACTCSWNKDGYCPEPGTVIDGYCYWGDRFCTEDGCSLNRTLMGCNDECDPEVGPKDTVGPTTTQLNLQRKCNIINVTANVSNCNNIEEAEYFYDECPDVSVRGQPMSALDGLFDETSEIVYVYNIDLANTTEILLDGRHNIYIRGKDEFGNWGNCSAIGFDLDIYPPYAAQQYVEPQMACGNDVTVTALVCEPEFINQSFICSAEFFVDNFTTANGEGHPMTPIDGVWGDDFCEWVTGTFDASQLIEGTHYIKVHGMDCFCNWGKIDFLAPVWFIRDTVHPTTSKQLIPFDNETEQCFDNEQAELPVGVELTDGCAYVKGGTQVVLGALDQDTPDHEYSDNVRIHWKVWYKVNSGDPWTVDQEGVGEINQSVTITLEEDSYHLIEYWSADSCGNEEPHHFELDIVDNKPPITTKTIDNPKIQDDGFTWITKDTKITLNCTDQTPHPVNHVTLFWRWKLDDGSWNGWYSVTGNEFAIEELTFNDDSIHTLQWYCVDTLGNEETTQTETDRVDNTPPNTTKTYGTPLVTTNGSYPKWINSSTPITLTTVDGGDICHVGVDKTWYKDRVLYGEDQIACYNPQEYCKPQLLEDCQYCQNGNYPKECINQQQEYCTEEMEYEPYTEDWYDCVEEESYYHCCGGWDWTLYRNEPIFKPEESCHVLYYFSVDSLGNVEDINVNCFFVENTPPVSQKNIGEPKKQVDCSTLGEGTFTDDCYYVTQDTQINLTCSDGDPHPVDNVEIWYKIDWKEYEEDSWTEGTWTEDSNFVSFNYDQDSFHRLTWYCVDALGNKEQEHVELDIVDTQKPVSTKSLGDPKHACTPEEQTLYYSGMPSQTDGCYFITQNTPINLTCSDGQPHPVDNVKIYYRDYLFDTTPPSFTEVNGDHVTITKNEDSRHILEWYCIDELGNKENNHVEYDIVDTQVPTTTKEIIGPQYWFEEKHFIDGVSRINLTCSDGDTHPVDHVNIYYRYRVNDGSWTGWTQYATPFGFPEESKHELEYYCIDALGNEETHQFEIDYVDKTPPVTTKTYGTPFYTEEGSEWINSSTSITLIATDGESIHASGVDDTYWRVTLVDDRYCSGEWNCQEAQGSGSGSWNVYSNPFTIPTESCHLIEFYSVDNVNKTETVKKQCPFVENTPPLVNKSVGEPKFAYTTTELIQYMDNYDVIDPMWYVNQSTPITLTCSDGEPHPVDHVNIYYKYYNNGQLVQDWTQYTSAFTYGQDSYHELYYYCVDALGNKGPTHVELDIVDSQYPNVTKNVGDPKVSCGNNCWYITNETEITLECNDGEPHPVDHVSTFYRYYLDGVLIQNWTLYSNPFTLPEYSNHTVEYYCKDILGNTGPIFTEEDKVDNIPPVIIPDPCYNIKPEDKVTIWAIITDDKIGINQSTTKAFIQYPNGTIEELLLVYNSTSGRYEAEWTAPDLEGVYYVDFAASDLLGSSTYLEDGKFIIVDNTPPQISSVFAGRTWIGLGDKFYVDAEINDNSVHFEETCGPIKCFVRIVDNAGKTGYLQGQLEFVQGVSKCAGFVTVNDTFYEAQAQLWVDAIDGAGNMASERKLEPIGIDNARMISITGVNESQWFMGGQWINGVVATVDSSIFGEVISCSASISGVSPENTLHPIGNNCSGNIRIPTDISDGEKNLTVYATNINGKIVSDTVNVRIDNNAPNKQILSPTNGTYVSTEIPVILNVTDELSGVKNASFRVVKDPLVIFGLVTIPGTGYDSGWISTAFNGTTWNYTFNASDLIAGETYYFLSLVCDNAGNCLDPLSYTIMIVDKTPPSWPLLSKLIVTSSPYDKDGDVILGWPEASDKNGVDHYDISINGIMKTATAGTAYTFLNLSNGIYSFSVIPVDKTGNRGTGLTGSTTVNRSCTVDVICTSSGTPAQGVSGGGASGGGTSYGGSSTSSGSTTGTSGATNRTVETTNSQTEIIQDCIPYWICSSWSSCSDGKQTRKCVDKNGCVETSRSENQDCNVEISPATGLLTLINSPVGYAVIASLVIFVTLAVLSKKRYLKKLIR